MAHSPLTRLPPEVILRIFHDADDFMTVNALVRTSSIFHSIWLMNANSIARTILPRSIECYDEAHDLVQAQTCAQSTTNTHEDRNRSHREIIIVLVRQYLTNARLVCSFYESNIRPVLVNLTAEGKDVSALPLLKRTSFIGTLYRLKTLALVHGYSLTKSPVLSRVGHRELVDIAELASWFRRASTQDCRTEIGVEALLRDTRWFQTWMDDCWVAITIALDAAK